MKKYWVDLMMVAIFFAAGYLFADDSKSIYEYSRIKGGLVVHVGCGNGEKTAALRVGEQYLIQGLNANHKDVTKARKFIRQQNLCGSVSMRYWDGERLPYADNTVNLLILSNISASLTELECRRVLAPRGVAIWKKETKSPLKADDTDSNWQCFVEPQPEDIDEWTHFLHDATGNAVAKDKRIGPPKSLSWHGGPLYSRSHEIDVSMVALVSTNGRIFYIVDNGITGMMDKHLEENWALMARDAFNGVILWEKPLSDFGWPMWKPELGERESWLGLIAQRRLIPVTLPRRLIANGNRVYSTLGMKSSLTAFDAATGKELIVYPDTKGADELLLIDSVLLATKRPSVRSATESPSEVGQVMAFDAISGKALWSTESGDVLPLSLTADEKRVFYHNGKSLICLDLKSGNEVWANDNTNINSSRFNTIHTLVAWDNMLFICTNKKLQAYNAATGKLIWEGKGGRKGFASAAPADVYIVNKILWTPVSTKPGIVTGRDPYTGEIKKEIKTPTCFYTGGHHIRCYRGKATERYMIEDKRGMEFLDMQGDNHAKTDWVRGVCRYGVLPCNGLVYSTPHPCSCYPKALLNGFNALSATEVIIPEKQQNGLVKGTAYGSSISGKNTATDWPTFRGNALRSGSTTTPATTNLLSRWSMDLGGKLTQPVVADNKVFVAASDQHTLYCLNIKTGKKIWSYVAGGRIDSPPTYHNGRLLFGARDGWVYHLKATTGSLVWRYRAAPTSRQIVVNNQLESSWPLHGSSLVIDEVLYVAAGRSSYLDGGIFLTAFDIATGKVLYENNVKTAHQDPEKDKGNSHKMDGVKLDILLFDGKYIHMQCAVFNKKLEAVDPSANDLKKHLFAVAVGGFLDDRAWNRNTRGYGKVWSMQKKMTAPFNGELLVHDDSLLYGIKYFTDRTGQSNICVPAQRGYHLFADQIGSSSTKGKKIKKDIKGLQGKKDKKKKGKKDKKGKKGRGGMSKFESNNTSLWYDWIPIRVRAMVKAGDLLYVAGPPDVIDPKDPNSAFLGRKGAVLNVFNAQDGKLIKEHKLAHPPVYDGMITAQGCLFISLKNGTIICLGE